MGYMYKSGKVYGYAGANAPSDYKKLLWSNPSPTTSFTTQTISLDLAGYDDVEIYAKRVMSADGSVEAKASIGGKGDICAVYGSNCLYRGATVSTTGITFTHCYIDGVANNDYLIPIHIYGIKYERVTPPQIEYPTYSTEEQQVGTWINGKPMYRKVLIGTSTAGVTSIDISSLNIAFPVSANIIIHNTNGNWVFGNYIQASGSDSFNMYMHENFSTLYLRSGSSYAFGSYWIILEYTKTID